MQCWETLPEKFLAKINDLVSDTLREQVAASFCNPKPVSIRTNTLRTNREAVLEEFRANNITVIPVPWYPDAFIYPHNKQTLTELSAYKRGEVYIQNLSSMVPALVLDPKPGEVVLDMCAAPGSKTTQIAAMMQNTGTIIANDRSRQRMFKLQANLQEQGATNVKTLVMPGEILWKKYPNFFDRVLVDAPCSMEGRFLASDPETYKDWSPKKVKLLSQSQKWLLRSAITATKPGGTIVYSTCTLSPEENEEILHWVLKTESYPLEIEKVTIENLQGTSAITTWGNQQLVPQIKNALRILPDTQMEAFFVAKIKKL